MDLEFVKTRCKTICGGLALFERPRFAVKGATLQFHAVDPGLDFFWFQETPLPLSNLRSHRG